MRASGLLLVLGAVVPLLASCHEDDKLACPTGVSTCEPARRAPFTITVPTTGPAIAGVSVSGPCSVPSFVSCDERDGGTCSHSVRVIGEPDYYRESGPDCRITLRAAGTGAMVTKVVRLLWEERRCCVTQTFFLDLYVQAESDAAEPDFGVVFPAGGPAGDAL